MKICAASLWRISTDETRGIPARSVRSAGTKNTLLLADAETEGLFYNEIMDIFLAIVNMKNA